MSKAPFLLELFLLGFALYQYWELKKIRVETSVVLKRVDFIWTRMKLHKNRHNGTNA